MAKLDQEKFAAKAWLVAIANKLAKLLDPHLPSKVEYASEEEHWPLRQTILFVVGVSLVLWAMGYVVFRFLASP